MTDNIYVDGQLALKANQLTTYTKSEVYTALGLKANQSITYTTNRGRFCTRAKG
ncbi:MAG: hypothetical protein ACKPKO_29190 [Candidatus Fonsibacter sp.]